ncbi:MAG: aldo/keto reductase, partial [Anaerolineales bacterium]|nr:aldo/keto reductase [Anaerolineales bacterium]
MFSAESRASTNFLDEIEMGLGTWAWGDRIFWNYGKTYTDDDIAAAFYASLNAGVRLVDTAEIYGNGKSETLLGRLIAESGAPVLVATKFFPFPWRQTRHSVVRALQNSLKRLGLQQVDLYQIHWPTPLTP